MYTHIHAQHTYMHAIWQKTVEYDKRITNNTRNTTITLEYDKMITIQKF